MHKKKSFSIRLSLCFLFVFSCFDFFATPLVVWAQSSDESNFYGLNEIENLIEQESAAHLVMGYELGDIDWSLRVLRTLSVGTHTILSPTGGWGKQDLQQVAIQRGVQKFRRLSAELFKEALELSHCDWQARSKLFKSESPRWMSDGSVHLLSLIRFEVYEACRDRSYSGTTVEAAKTNKDERSSSLHGLEVDIEQPSEHVQLKLLEWFNDLEKSLKTNKRQGISLKLKLKKDSPYKPLDCLSIRPQLRVISEQNTQEMLKDVWEGVRWFWMSGTTNQHQLESKLKPSLFLGEAECFSSKTASQKAQPYLVLKQFDLINRLKKRAQESDLELWIWVEP